MPDVWFAIPGDLAALTGGYAYARRLIAALPSAGWIPRHLRLPAEFPKPSASTLSATRSILSAVPAGAIVLVDGLAFSALPREMLADFDLGFVALVHHPLAAETGLSESEVEQFKDCERAALAAARAVVVTSRHTRETLVREYGVARGKLCLAPPGTDQAARARGSGPTAKLLTVATLTHRKAHDVLIAALARLADLAWSCDLVGSLDRDPRITANVRALIKASGLEARVRLLGELQDSALDAAYAGSDIFVLPSRHEGYGMVFAEALARGLPIVACAAGAVTETVPAAASVLVPVDNPAALSEALRRLLTDPIYRKQLSDAAWDHGRGLPTWSDTAAQVGQALIRSSQ
ncbi:MAG: glycosyltransferase [Rhodospirillaceae bacterium]|nr:glycosyltransferase [Rhodospirillaceae bacterium]